MLVEHLRNGRPSSGIFFRLPKQGQQVKVESQSISKLGEQHTRSIRWWPHLYTTVLTAEENSQCPVSV